MEVTAKGVNSFDSADDRFITSAVIDADTVGIHESYQIFIEGQLSFNTNACRLFQLTSDVYLYSSFII